MVVIVIMIVAMRIISNMNKYYKTFEEKAHDKAYSLAHSIRKSPCPSCGLHGCICQRQLRPNVYKNIFCKYCNHLFKAHLRSRQEKKFWVGTCFCGHLYMKESSEGIL